MGVTTEPVILKETQERAIDFAALTDAMARGDEAAFRVFFEGYFHRLLRYLIVVAHGDEELAREALQLTLVRVARYVKRFESETAFWDWLAVLARSSISDEKRKSKRYLGFLKRWFEQKQIQTETLAESQGHDRMNDLLGANLSSLPDDERDLVARKYLEGQSVREISEDLSLSEKAVESRLGRIRAKLKKSILETLKNET